MSSSSIAIIGAGLSGLALALSLHQQSIPCIIYESRPASLDIGGAIMLSPNALKILNALGVYERIKPESYEFDQLYFRSEDDQPLDTFEFGNKSKYGYDALRVYRSVLIRELLALVHQRGIPVYYRKKFTRIVSETEKDVTFEFEDGEKVTAPLLIGADGIHSRVRKYLYPDLEPRFTDAVGVTAAVPTKQLQVPQDYNLPVTIMNKKHGAFVIATQQPDGSEVLIGKQRRAPEVDREGWNRLLAEKTWCIEFLREGAEDFPPIVRNAVSDIPSDRINLWPFYLVPKLKTWVSEHRSVVLVGDAAHAIPPTAGQGVNQAFEDVYTLSLVMGGSKREEWAALLKTWQDYRQGRVDRILELNDRINARRMPKKAGEEEDGSETKPFDLEWLYSSNFGAVVRGWLAVGKEVVN